MKNKMHTLLPVNKVRSICSVNRQWKDNVCFPPSKSKHHFARWLFSFITIITIRKHSRSETLWKKKMDENKLCNANKSGAEFLFWKRRHAISFSRDYEENKRGFIECSCRIDESDS